MGLIHVTIPFVITAAGRALDRNRKKGVLGRSEYLQHFFLPKLAPEGRGLFSIAKYRCKPEDRPGLERKAQNLGAESRGASWKGADLRRPNPWPAVGKPRQPLLETLGHRDRPSGRGSTAPGPFPVPYQTKGSNVWENSSRKSTGHEVEQSRMNTCSGKTPGGMGSGLGAPRRECMQCGRWAWSARLGVQGWETGGLSG